MIPSIIMTRTSIDVKGLEHANPIPNGSRIGPFFVSSLVLGRDADSAETPAGLGAQCAIMFRNVRSIVETAGGSTRDIISMNVLMRDRSQRDVLNTHWLEMFPDAASRPARQVAQLDSKEFLVQCTFMAVFGAA